MTIDEEYMKRFSKSQELFQRSRKAIVRAATHDIRYFEPFPPFVERADGSRKWTAEGYELVDYWMGHGALLLGHNPPQIVSVMEDQISNGTHAGGAHRFEVALAEKIIEMIPSAERVEFAMTGTEATMVAIRLARSYTGKSKVLKFQYHFHGWHDYAAAGMTPPFEVSICTGVPQEALDTMLVAPHNDIEETRRLLDEHDDVGVVILEPAGPGACALATDIDFLRQLREETKKRGIALIFDEVVTGFRYSPGGAQAKLGVIPDLTALGKIMGGGLPSAAVAGRKEILEMLLYKDSEWNRFGRSGHGGTFNANPLVARAGLAMLNAIDDGKAQKKVDDYGASITKALNEVIRRQRVRGCVHCQFSVVHFFLGERNQCLILDTCEKVNCTYEPIMQHMGELRNKLRRGMLLEGVDVMRGDHCYLCTALDERDHQQTVEAFEKTLIRLKEEGDL
jgi:glutamate-1-semialdehyde 2,1-aminomutase